MVGIIRRPNESEAHHSKNPVDPSVSDMICNKAKDEWSNWDTERDHQGPYPHVSRALFLEKRLGYHGTSDCCGGTDEEGDYGSAQRH